MAIILLALSAFIGCAMARPEGPANVVMARNLDGSGNFAYQTADGQSRSESQAADGSVRGSYSYPSPDGQILTVNYVADNNGFRAVGDHLPRAPVVPLAPVPMAPVPMPITLSAPVPIANNWITGPANPWMSPVSPWAAHAPILRTTGGAVSQTVVGPHGWSTNIVH